MKKMLKSFGMMVGVVLLCLMCTVTAIAATNIPEATSDFYVNDFADVFSESQKESLMNNAVALANENDGVQVVVTTVKSLEGATVGKIGSVIVGVFFFAIQDADMITSLQDARI